MAVMKKLLESIENTECFLHPITGNDSVSSHIKSTCGLHGQSGWTGRMKEKRIKESQAGKTTTIQIERKEGRKAGQRDVSEI